MGGKLEPEGHLFPLARENRLEHRIHAVPRDLRAALGADRLAHAGEQESQVVGDFGHRPHGRPPGLSRRALTNREGGGETFHPVVVGAGESLEELLRVGRHAFDVPALAFGVDRVERKGRLPGAADPRDDGQGGAGELDVDILEVVLAGAVEPDRTLPFS